MDPHFNLPWDVEEEILSRLPIPSLARFRTALHALLDGYDLAAHIDETAAKPDPTLTVDGSTTPNPAFTLWTRQDKLIYSALLGAISLSVQPLLSRSSTAAEVWATLAATYAKPSRGHIKQLQQQLKHWSKGSKSINDYFQGLTTRFDQLALLGKLIDHEDQVDFVLQGLPDEYKPIIDQTEGRDSPPTLTELHEKLINHEVKLQTMSTVSSLPISANYASNRSSSSTKNNQRSSQPWTNNNNKPNDRTPRPYLGRCQLCGATGHSARRCHLLNSGSQNSRGPLLPTPTYPPTSWQPRAHFTTSANANPWVFDTGATHHITSDLANLSLHQPYNGGEEVLVGNGNSLPISHTGFASIPLLAKTLSLNNVLCVPQITKNLISVYRLCNANKVSVEFFPAHFQVKDLNSGVPLLQGRTKDELYEWPIPKPVATALFATPTIKASLSDWHSRLGHPSHSILKTIISSFSLPFSESFSKTLSCVDCLTNKSHKLAFSQTSISSSKPLEYLFSDLWTSPVVSVDNYKHYLIIVDHYTRYSWFYPLKLKSDVKEIFIRFKALVENKFKTKIVTLFSDNGGEFIALRTFLSTSGITHLTSPPHTPEHNGLVERRHRHIVETGLSLLHHAQIPNTFWSYAFSTAVYLINRMPTPTLSLQSPFSMIFGFDPNYSKLKIFGCLCFPWLRPYRSHKLEPRSTSCVFLGYSLTQSAYLCFDPLTNRLFVSRHVRFDEQTFPYQRLLQSNSETPSSNWTSPLSFVPISNRPLVSVPPSSSPPGSDPSPTPTLPSDQTPTSPVASTPTSPVPNGDLSPASSHPLNAPSNQSHNSVATSPSVTHTSDDSPSSMAHTQSNSQLSAHSSPTTTTQSPSTTPRPTNTPSPSPSSSSTSSLPSPSPPPAPPSPSPPPAPVIMPPENNHNMATRAKSGISKPNKKYALLTPRSDAIPPIPTSVAQALADPRWSNAMSEEYTSVLRHGTYTLVPKEPHHNIVSCRWIYTHKFNPNGSLRRLKARYVAKGYNQRRGVDFTETFSPVIKSTSLRVVLDVAVSRDWPIKQLDVNNAFLQGSLEEEVYVAQPPGFIDPDRPHHVCRLHKALYGLKQAPRAWYRELSTFLTVSGFTNSLADPSLFILNRDSSLLYILVYVDDIVITGNNPRLLQHTLDALATRFSIKDPEDLNYFLGIEAFRTSFGLHLTQRRYILDLLQRCKMSDAKPVQTPMAAYPKLTLRSGSPLPDPTEYRSVVGSLQYLAFTRPDISYAVNRLSQFMHAPTTEHWQATKRLLRYLAGTSSHGTFYSRSNPTSLHAYSDADWGGDIDDYVSTNAYIVYLGKHPISWSSKKQRGVARSSTEAEYRSVANTSAELRWICSLLTELGISIPSTPVIYCDNVGVTYLCANPIFHSRMKHLALDYHFIRNQITSGVLRVAHVSSKDQLADALTKPLTRAPFKSSTSKIGVSHGLWNPCLRQFKWIKYEAQQFEVFGLGYDNTKPEKVYKILGFITRKGAAVYECSSREFEFIDTPCDRVLSETAKRLHVSLNGNLYWVAYNGETREYFIQSFDFSRDRFETCCLLPGQEMENSFCDELVLAVFVGDRFSLLKQCFVTREIEIWVTKKKINRDDEVVWVSLMTLTASNLPRLFSKLYGISYFIHGKTLIMCCGDDETREPCIYVARGDLCIKIPIDSDIGWFSHCVYVPSLISVPLEFHEIE
ncbi:unnamed protein product [Microthlaspi erraticum]|uniref:Integrase catalytic domain-containing protein n=1 Tax=Microthlaspi erraticum TaxID=1685480 RepID=A0A6D2KTA4_9BRAS|nr:unnamed protein product [Microthlaspi erraticum]